MKKNSGPVARAGVIGHPISHSKSPIIHRHWLAQYGMEGEYAAWDIAPESLKGEAENLLRQSGMKGFNVTIPHKQAIMSCCTKLDGTAQQIGAVNTVVLRDSGEVEGRNTDAFGFLESARESHPDFNWASGPALILGAGGAARAVVYALKTAGVPEIRIANRNRERAERLAKEFGLGVCAWEEREQGAKMAHSLINTTSLGMAGQPDLEIDIAGLASGALVYDIVYAPLETTLLKKAREKGLRSVTGIGMLLHQARPAFAAWFGIMPEVTEELRRKVTGV